MASKLLRFHPEAEEEYLLSLSWYRERSLVVVELVVYVPMAVVQRASLEGFNYLAHTDVLRRRSTARGRHAARSRE